MRYIEKTEKVEEYYENGSLSYECTFAVIKKGFEYLFPSRIERKNDSVIRINHATRYEKNGDIRWRFIYNDMGEKINHISKTGTKFYSL